MIQYNGLTLAYIGDAYYELRVRNYLLEKQFTKVGELHDNAIRYTNAISQAKAAKSLCESFYNELELSVFKRGRNATSTHKPKNADIQTYNAATGFEAVIGYLYLDQQLERLDELLKQAYHIIEEL